VRRLRLGASGAGGNCGPLGAHSAASGPPKEFRSTSVRPEASCGPSTSPLGIYFMRRSNVRPFRRKSTGKALIEVGGPIAESGATLCAYGADLRPEDVTALLGVTPTRSWCRGDRRKPHSAPATEGGWILEVRGKAPHGPEIQLATLLAKLPETNAVWEELNRRYRTTLTFGLHMSGWNQGFELSRELITRIQRLGVGVNFDIYAYGDDA